MTWITTKLLGYVSGGLLVALLLSSGFVALQTSRLGTAQTALKTETAAKDLAVTVANERTAALIGRDETIKAQSDSIDALASASQQSRTVYVAGIAAANSRAQTNEARAAQIIQLPAPAPDARCEAARSLIESELSNVR